MPGEQVYELYIDAFTPETIPMARLADYMASFAELLGQREHVHFGELKPGSLSRCPRISSHSEWGVRYSSSARAFRGERG